MTAKQMLISLSSHDKTELSAYIRIPTDRLFFFFFFFFLLHLCSIAIELSENFQHIFSVIIIIIIIIIIPPLWENATPSRGTLVLDWLQSTVTKYFSHNPV